MCICVTVCARGVWTFKINWFDERGALGLSVAPVIHLVMSLACVRVNECVSVCVCVCVRQFVCMPVYVCLRVEFQSIK